MNRAGRRLLLLGWMHAYTYCFLFRSWYMSWRLRADRGSTFCLAMSWKIYEQKPCLGGSACNYRSQWIWYTLSSLSLWCLWTLAHRFRGAVVFRWWWYRLQRILAIWDQRMKIEGFLGRVWRWTIASIQGQLHILQFWHREPISIKRLLMILWRVEISLFVKQSALITLRPSPDDTELKARVQADLLVILVCRLQ